MSTYYSGDGFSTNDVSGAIAVAVLHDLHVNGHVFTGFPAVAIQDVPPGFVVHLELSGCKSSPLEFLAPRGRRLESHFGRRPSPTPSG